ncbi:glycosyltransferase family 4 protein [Dokdonella sp.]|uniref:glycosyltransferase family 4 protein n=1 Tax=Dokdonella sp. TaxID=2291710 RepID=UPI003AF86C34
MRHEARDCDGFVHVGAMACELEFQRYMPRKVLSAELSNCDLIQVVCGTPAWANVVADLGKPVALQVATLATVERRRHASNPIGAMGWWRRRMTRVTRHLDDLGLDVADAILVENRWMLDYSRRRNAAGHRDIRFAPPGVDCEHFRPVETCRRWQRPYLLCVGRLDDPRKNVDLLLEAYAMLPPATLGRVGLVLAGSSGPSQAFWRRCEALGLRQQVKFIERPDDAGLLQLYQNAAAFAMSSDEEGFGMVLIEAMACGVPAVATRCGGPEEIISDGQDGYLVPRDDAATFRDRLQSLLVDPVSNDAMGRAARATVEKFFEERMCRAVYSDVWHRLLERRDIVGRASRMEGRRFAP